MTPEQIAEYKDMKAKKEAQKAKDKAYYENWKAQQKKMKAFYAKWYGKVVKGTKIE